VPGRRPGRCARVDALDDARHRVDDDRADLTAGNLLLQEFVDLLGIGVVRQDSRGQLQHLAASQGEHLGEPSVDIDRPGSAFFI